MRDLSRRRVHDGVHISDSISLQPWCLYPILVHFVIIKESLSHDELCLMCLSLRLLAMLVV